MKILQDLGLKRELAMNHVYGITQPKDVQDKLKGWDGDTSMNLFNVVLQVAGTKLWFREHRSPITLLDRDLQKLHGPLLG